MRKNTNRFFTCPKILSLLGFFFSLVLTACLPDDGGSSKKSSSGTSNAPTTAATAPDRPAGLVKSVFDNSSTSYTDITADFSGQHLGFNDDASTSYTTDSSPGSDTIKLSNFDYYYMAILADDDNDGSYTDLGTADVSGYNFIRIDLWSADANRVKISLHDNFGMEVSADISKDSADGVFQVGDLQQSWETYRIYIADMTGDENFDDEAIRSIKLDGRFNSNGDPADDFRSTIYIGNLFFYNKSNDTTLAGWKLNADGSLNEFTQGTATDVHYLDYGDYSTYTSTVLAELSTDAYNADASTDQTSDIPGVVNIGVTAEDGTTKDYAVYFGINPPSQDQVTAGDSTDSFLTTLTTPPADPFSDTADDNRKIYSDNSYEQITGVSMNAGEEDLSMDVQQLIGGTNNFYQLGRLSTHDITFDAVDLSPDVDGAFAKDLIFNYYIWVPGSAGNVSNLSVTLTNGTDASGDLIIGSGGTSTQWETATIQAHDVDFTVDVDKLIITHDGTYDHETERPTVYIDNIYFH